MNSNLTHKTKTRQNKRFDLILMCIGTVLVMLRSLRILYVRGIPEGIIYGFGFVCFVIYIMANFRKLQQFTVLGFISLFVLLIVYIYEQMTVSAFKLPSTFNMVTLLMGAFALIQAPLEDKRTIYRAYNVTIQVMVGIGLIAWILFLFNFPLPYYTDNSDNYYHYNVYYVFNLVLSSNPLDLLYRYAGPFLEPGHCGTMCVYLLYINGMNLKNVGNIFLLLGVLFSLSLAAYGLLAGAVLILFYVRRKYISIAVMAGLFVLLGITSQYLNNGDNPLYQIVFSRLELNENGDDIIGNNRTSGFFDLTYSHYLNSDNIVTGVGRRAFGQRSDGTDNATIGSAGYKRYFFIRGIIGSVLICSFLLLYTVEYGSRMSIGYFIIYLISNIIRDYPLKEQWMYLFLLAMPLMYYYGPKINMRQRDNGEDDKSESEPDMGERQRNIPKYLT